MELKNYQKNVMNDLSSFMSAVDQENDIVKGWQRYWSEKDICIGLGGVPAYQNMIKGVPHVCMKVPTGGGKTFMACSAVKQIFEHLPKHKPKVIIWLVPSDSILSQTIRTLSDIDHPYRQRLNKDFAGRVGVYTKDMLLNGQNFSPDTVSEMLTICVLSYASLRIDSKKKDVRKVYQENGNLFRFADFFDDKSILLSDTPDTALIQVLRYLSPVVIVDESHNAGSTLSVEMLNNLNPSFVLELTATPRKSSNIISYVDARELKKESMVKLPVVVFNRNSRQAVIQDAIQLRGNIEKQALAEQSSSGKYIRPIVLFQAQPRINEDSDTFDKIKKLLTDMGIPQEQIAVKTSNVDDIGNIDLMSSDCEIRYIITVNALKEGWDCPFAYILASLANKTSRVDVEQILGRILRQPYTRLHSEPLLNTSFVLTCSDDFHSTLENIVMGLNKSGFSRKDYRVSEDALVPESPNAQPRVEPKQISLLQESDQIDEKDDTFEDVNPIEIKQVISSTPNGTGVEDEVVSESGSAIEEMIKTATEQSQSYSEDLESTLDEGFIGGDLGNMLSQNTIQKRFQDEVKELLIPQFFVKSVPDLFGNEFELLEPENLSEGFSLVGQDAQVSFELATGEMYQVDIQAEGEAVPKYKRASKSESEYVQKYLESLPQEERINQCAQMIANHVNKNNRYATADVEGYVRRVISNMSENELSVMETSIATYAARIQKKIDGLEMKYRREMFKKWLDSGKLVCRDSYKLEAVITASPTIDSISDSLYEAEKNDMNNFERQVIDVVVGTDNIRWWHRIIDRRGFRLNGYFNHYPDFMVMTKSGKIVLIEAKGDYLDGDDSKTKLELGRKWQDQAGSKYRYFMVFKDKELGMDGAYTIDKFIDIMKEL